MPIALRCYVTEIEDDSGAKSEKKSTHFDSPKASDSLVLAFDTETTIDEYQNLMFGSCGIWVNGALKQFYLFYNEEILKQRDIEPLKVYAADRGHILLTRKEFVEKIFYPYVYTARAKCVGFNLPFDISRLTIAFTNSRKFHDGFSLKLSGNPQLPNIIIKSLNSKASFIEFTKPSRYRKSEKKNAFVHFKGCFIDLRTASFGLTNNSYSLEGALQAFDCTMTKTHPESHGKVSEEYVDYNVNDALSTYELYTKVLQRYAMYGLAKDISKIYSPASIGKAFLNKIGIKSFLEMNPEFPKEVLGKLMSTYYGGRTELRLRKTPIKVAYLDATSMYPTVYSLLRMDSFLKASTIRYKDSTAETQALLDGTKIDNIRDKHFWHSLMTICRIRPNDDILPVRSRYDARNTYNIGINHLKAVDDLSLWYTLGDLVASKLLRGKTPKIEEAITFDPSGIQSTLSDIEIVKGISVRHDEDLIKKLIEERIRIRKESKNLALDKRKTSDIAQNILKIIANSISYGIYIEINSEHLESKHSM